MALRRPSVRLLPALLLALCSPLLLLPALNPLHCLCHAKGIHPRQQYHHQQQQQQQQQTLQHPGWLSLLQARARQRPRSTRSLDPSARRAAPSTLHQSSLRSSPAAAYAPAPAPAQPQGRPCSPLSGAKRLVVRWPRDIWQRLKFPPGQTVVLSFPSSLWLPQGLNFTAAFSCSILQATAKGGRIRLYYKGWDAPVVSIVGAGNMLFIGIGLQNAVTAQAPACDPKIISFGGDTSVRCPALYIAKSYGIQYTKAPVYGRIDVMRSAGIRLDSLKATMAPNSYSTVHGPDDWSNHGVIRVVECSPGPSLEKANIFITNNEVFGSWELISLYRWTTGAVVRNNLLHHYRFAAIRCGADLSFTMDCNRNSIDSNYIWSKPGQELTGDSGAIYFDTHWFNPGNELRCNYIIGGDHCYYLDMSTSAVTITGGTCIGTLDGFKVATGKFNKIRDVVMYGLQKFSTYITCLGLNFNCVSPSYGYGWEKIRKEHWDTPAINKAYPWMASICNPVASTINGVACNPPGGKPASETGSCSGVPYGNYIRVVLVNSTIDNLPKDKCKEIPTWSTLNDQNFKRFSWEEAAFLGPGNFGVRKTSKILRDVPGFTSCPRGTVGPRKVASAGYYKSFNVPRPGVLSAIIALNTDDIHTAMLRLMGLPLWQ